MIEIDLSYIFFFYVPSTVSKFAGDNFGKNTSYPCHIFVYTKKTNV